MKKRKGYIISILVFILILCTLIGCGKTPSGSDSTQGAVTETETEKGTQLGSEEDTSNTEDFATETEENIFPQYVMTDIDYRAVVEADEDMMVSKN